MTRRRHHFCAASALILISILNCLHQITCNTNNSSSSKLNLEEEIPFEEFPSQFISNKNEANLQQSGGSSHNSFVVDPFGATFDEFLRDSQQITNLEQADQASQPDSSEQVESKKHAQLVVGQLFAWKSLATSKCSRACGGGFRINHISCVDKKYDVRVEDELCSLKASDKRPAELSRDEFCNHFDCPPAWHSLDAQSRAQFELGQQLKACSSTRDEHCACIQLRASGRYETLDASKCNQQAANTSTSTPAYASITIQNNNTKHEHPNVHEELINFEPDHEEVSLDEINLNNILQADSDAPASQQHHHSKPQAIPNEPFYEPLPWSDCKPKLAELNGLQCGSLGFRQRQLSCRMFLSRSNKLVELGLESCDNAATINLVKPDTEEPCYLDCQAATMSSSRSNISDGAAANKELSPADLADETVYDLEMTRYEWRHGAWSKCNAECLGGQRESLVECWDKLLDVPVELQNCESDLKPQSRIETCNDLPCPVEWRFEPYGHCSRVCGSDGVRPRHLVCVQKTKTKNKPDDKSHSNPITITMSWRQEDDQEQQQPDNFDFHYLIVPLELCSNSQSAGPQPQKVEPCNRHNCPPQWVNGPWSECNTQCGVGSRQRNVSCVQELADKIPIINYKQQINAYYLTDHHHSSIGSGRLIGQSGHTIQLPFERCYNQYKMVPSLEETCYGNCLNQLFIDSHKDQDLEISSTRERKSISLRVGGRARLFEGMNLNLRCKIMKRIAPDQKQHLDYLADNHNIDHHHDSPRLVKRISVPIEWRFDSQLMFPNGTQTSDKRFINAEHQAQLLQHHQQQHADGSVDDDGFDNDIIFGAQAAAIQADQPQLHKHNNNQRHRKMRNLSVRSWNIAQDTPLMQFVPDSEGRFSLSRGNTLKIKRLRPEDSGRYRCSHGNLSETLDLQVISPLELTQANKNNNHQQQQHQMATSQDKARAQNELIN